MVQRPVYVAVLVVLWSIGGARVAGAQEGAELAIGERLTLFSETLNEERTILVGKPDSYDASDDAYPVLILLDGDAHFHHTTGVTKFLARNQFSPELLVVGIENTIRPRDLTPPSVEPFDIEAFPVRGGAADFQTFIGDELIPWLDERYRTRAYRILVGHSHGGLFAVYSLTTRPDLFDAYIAISPSLQWDGQRFVEQAGEFLASTDELEAALYLTAGNEGGELLGGIRKLASALDASTPRAFEWRFDHMPLETHGSVPLRSTYQGLEFVFADWTLRDPMAVYDRYGAEAIERFFAASDAKYGYDRGPPLFVLSRIAVALLDAGRLDEVMALIRRYEDLNRPPPRVFVRIADQYREQGRTESAIEAYEMALAVESPDPRDVEASAAARAALTDLGGGAAD